MKPKVRILPLRLTVGSGHSLQRPSYVDRYDRYLIGVVLGVLLSIVQLGIRLHRLTVKITACRAEDRGSIPLGAAKLVHGDY